MKNWWKARQARNAEIRRCNGFGWAMAAHYLEGMSVETIRGYYSWPHEFARGAMLDPFDTGVREALGVINELEMFRQMVRVV